MLHAYRSDHPNNVRWRVQLSKSHALLCSGTRWRVTLQGFIGVRKKVAASVSRINEFLYSKPGGSMFLREFRKICRTTRRHISEEWPQCPLWEPQHSHMRLLITHLSSLSSFLLAPNTSTFFSTFITFSLWPSYIVKRKALTYLQNKSHITDIELLLYFAWASRVVLSSIELVN
jgi:hypothetical protein